MTAVTSYAASSALAKQIESGAPADIFISADLDWMDYVAKKDLVNEGTRANLLGNRIVLVTAKDKVKQVDIKQGFDLSGLLGDGRLAMGEVKSVPAGKYGKAALEKLGVWTSVESKVAGAESVRAALALVSRGEAPYGIVYQTDAAADEGVAIVGTFPADSHPPIIYPIAMLAEQQEPGRRRLSRLFEIRQGSSLLHCPGLYYSEVIIELKWLRIFASRLQREGSFQQAFKLSETAQLGFSWPERR